MEIFGKEILDEFAGLHKHADAPLKRWLSHTRQSQWNNFNELKETFGTADYYRGAVIFNIGGNKFRLIAIVIYDEKKVYIDQILTHRDYDENKWKKAYEGNQI